MRQLLIVIELPVVDLPVSARPLVPSATQADEAADQPEGRVTTTEVRSALRIASDALEMNRLRALGPPQMVLDAPEQGMLHAVDVRVKDAPFTKLFPQ